ncbi:thiamine phosphate synthase [Reinekea forsetii]|nr:thiamine phosphate synthase [Reinekea forsetii]
MISPSSHLLIIAGLESNGFAGALKDIEIAARLSIPPRLVVSTLTAQTNHSMLANEPTPAAVVKAQLESLQAPPSCIKIGVLPNSDQAVTIAHWLKNLGPNKPKVVLDPIKLSSSDRSAFSDETLANIILPLIPYVDVITPNLSEYCDLTNTPKPLFDHKTAFVHFKVAFPLFRGCLYIKSALVDSKNSRVTDLLIQHHTPTEIQYLTQHMSELNLRGTGCVFSTALTCALFQQHSIESSAILASACLTELRDYQLRSTKPDIGWPINVNYYPTVSRRGLPTVASAFPRMADQAGLYPIVDSSAWIAKLASWGVRTVQLRLKNRNATDIEAEVIKSVAIAKQHQLQLFINDYWQLAIKHNAYGVHLGQEDLQSADIEKIHSAGLRLGISTHGDYEFLIAKQLRPSYYAVGAIFPTKTKDMSGKIQGIERLKRYCFLAQETPVVAIGGITQQNIIQVLSAQPNFIAMVSAITEAKDPECVTKELLKTLSRG